MLPLRPYQQEAVQAVLDAAAQGTRRSVLVLPTGAGKTVVAAALSQRVPGRTLMLVHREELVRQSVEKFRFAWPAGDIGVVQADRDEPDRRIVVASVQTLQHARRRARLDGSSFSLVIADEAHHAPAPSWQTVLTHLGFLPQPGPDQILLGLTATPERGDRVSLRSTFDRVVYAVTIGQLIEQGYLSPVRGLQIWTRVDLSRVAVDHGDFNLKSLSLAVDTPDRNQLVVNAWRRHAADRRTVVFAVDVAHARHLAAAFQQHGVRADWVAGTLPAAERQARLQAFHRGTIQVLVNCQILTEGWDEPATNAILLARPTRSKSLYVQMVGRGLRLYPGKPDCLVVDVADNRHDLITLAILRDEGVELTPQHGGRRPPRPAVATPARRGAAPLDGVVELAARPVDLLARSAFAWRREGRRLVLTAAPGHLLLLEPADDERYWVRHLGRGQRDLLHQEPLRLDYAQGVAEEWVRQHGYADYARRDAAWRQRPASARQLAFLARLGDPVPEGITQEDAQERIRQAIRAQRLADPDAPWRNDPATPKQRAWLEAHGIRVKPTLTKGEAADIMNRFFQRKRPS